jgi:enoyl-CoA hydratase
MTISTELQGHVAVVTMASENGLNVADLALMTGLRDELAALAADDRVRVLILTGAGERAFCAGADIRYMSETDTAAGEAWGRLGHEVGRLLETMPKATIAALGGVALGGGCELALACDLRYAGSSARLGQPEVGLGIIPGWGGTQRLARVAGLGFAKELVLTGRVVDAGEALERGLVNGIHDPVLDRAREVALTIAAKGPQAIAAAKALCNRSLQGDHPANLDEEARVFGELLQGAEAREGLSAFVEKRPPSFSS